MTIIYILIPFLLNFSPSLSTHFLGSGRAFSEHRRNPFRPKKKNNDGIPRGKARPSSLPIAGKSILLPQGSLLAGDGANDKGRRYVAAEGIAGVRLLSAGVLRSLPRRDHREAPGVPQPFDLPQLQISAERGGGEEAVPVRR